MARLDTLQYILFFPSSFSYFFFFFSFASANCMTMTIMMMFLVMVFSFVLQSSVSLLRPSVSTTHSFFFLSGYCVIKLVFPLTINLQPDRPPTCILVTVFQIRVSSFLQSTTSRFPFQQLFCEPHVSLFL